MTTPHAHDAANAQALELPPDLAALDAALRGRAAQAAQAPSNALAGDFAQRVLAQAKARAAAPAGPAVVDVASLRAVARRDDRRTTLWRMAAAVAAVVAVALGYAGWQSAYAPVGHGRGGLIRPGDRIVAEKYRVYALLDDNRIQAYLAPGSTLEVASATEVALKSGEAWFMVRPNSGAFRVDAGGTAVHVVGTTFNVSFEESGLVVRTHAGKVRVVPPSGAEAFVTADQQWNAATGSLVSCQLNDLPKRSGDLWDWARNGAPDEAKYVSAMNAVRQTGPRTHLPRSDAP